ncbi:hypothetical protein FSP39_015168 [Pinctada imbricata]|uniref:Dendritic cell-specific transmembrane protein-like domain-containing protein n=1 Tax=Pinctada imbricata TaxID=66713 RepID=A0AA88YF62_PINIB|nr:hypothetical protein FSP39_015168 [Pinctada imbricata]
MHVQGDGSLADMYKAMVGMFDPMATGNMTLDTTLCLPNPSPPDYDVYNEIRIIFGLCTFMVIFESYGLRLRHVVAACYYPRRERERAAWLYNHILKMRGGFLKFMRRKIRQQYSTFDNEEKISIRSRLAEQFSLCRKLFNFLGWRKKYCLSCSKEGTEGDLDNFIHCASGDCKAIYCMDCFTDLNNLCTICMSPIEYGDFSDFSEERDSSEDEEEMARKKAEAEERRRNREEARLARRTSKRMMDIKLNLGVTDSFVRQQAGSARKQGPDQLSSLTSYSQSSFTSEDSQESSTETSSEESSDESFQFDESYQYRDKEDQTDDDLDDDIDNTVQKSQQTELVTTDIFDDERLENVFIDEGMNYAYDAIEPEELEIDREIVNK